jgi:hypothetical protein
VIFVELGIRERWIIVFLHVVEQPELHERFLFIVVTATGFLALEKWREQSVCCNGDSLLHLALTRFPIDHVRRQNVKLAKLRDTAAIRD